jgi:hypothetical protein
MQAHAASTRCRRVRACSSATAAADVRPPSYAFLHMPSATVFRHCLVFYRAPLLNFEARKSALRSSPPFAVPFTRTAAALLPSDAPAARRSGRQSANGLLRLPRRYTPRLPRSDKRGLARQMKASSARFQR